MSQFLPFSKRTFEEEETRYFSKNRIDVEW